VLADHARDEDIVLAGESAVVLYSNASAATLRDAFQAARIPALVLEFERWSASEAGPLLSDWLRRRGH
jgi:hypothetical protein